MQAYVSFLGFDGETINGKKYKNGFYTVYTDGSAMKNLVVYDPDKHKTHKDRYYFEDCIITLGSGMYVIAMLKSKDTAKKTEYRKVQISISQKEE